MSANGSAWRLEQYNRLCYEVEQHLRRLHPDGNWQVTRWDQDTPQGVPLDELLNEVSVTGEYTPPQGESVRIGHRHSLINAADPDPDELARVIHRELMVKWNIIEQSHSRAVGD
jgi:hypothetical protein